MNWKKQSPSSFSKGILKQAISHTFPMQDILHCYTKRTTTIQDAIGAAEAGVPVDMIQIDVTRTWELLGKLSATPSKTVLINEQFISHRSF